MTGLWDKLIPSVVIVDIPISTCTGQHLVDTKDVERVYADSQVERVFASSLCDILVGADTGCLERLAR
jgi:hypothetical protein